MGHPCDGVTVRRRAGVPGRVGFTCASRVLVRADSGGGTHEFLHWLTSRSRPLHYSVGMTLTEDMRAAILQVLAKSWTLGEHEDGGVERRLLAPPPPPFLVRPRSALRAELVAAP